MQRLPVFSRQVRPVSFERLINGSPVDRRIKRGEFRFERHEILREAVAPRRFGDTVERRFDSGDALLDTVETLPKSGSERVVIAFGQHTEVAVFGTEIVSLFNVRTLVTRKSISSTNPSPPGQAIQSPTLKSGSATRNSPLVSEPTTC